jgi:hypothetical protein
MISLPCGHRREITGARGRRPGAGPAARAPGAGSHRYRARPRGRSTATLPMIASAMPTNV